MTSSSGWRLHLANLFNTVLPPTRFRYWVPAVYRRAGVDIAEGAAILGGAVLQSGPISIGARSRIATQALLIANPGAPIIIGDDVGISARCVIITGSHDIGGPERRSGPPHSEAIYIGDGSWLGFSCMVVAGSRVGGGCVVAAGSVVNGSFGDNLLIGGVPARVIRGLPADGAPT